MAHIVKRYREGLRSGLNFTQNFAVLYINKGMDFTHFIAHQDEIEPALKSGLYIVQQSHLPLNLQAFRCGLAGKPSDAAQRAFQGKSFGYTPVRRAPTREPKRATSRPPLSTVGVAPTGTGPGPVRLAAWGERQP